MRTSASLLLFLTSLAWGQSPTHALIGLTTLAGAPAAGTGGCATTGHTATGLNYCGYVFYVAPHLNGEIQSLNANSIDLGTTGPLFTGWTATETPFQGYSPGFNATAISNTGGTTTASVSGGFWETNNVIYCANCGVYTGPWTLTGANYSGGNLVSVTWAQGGSPASCSSNCGQIMTACNNLPCRQEIVFALALNAPQNTASPNYVFSQGWANTACTHSAWTPSTFFAPHFCIWVPSVGHFFHATSVCATTGYCQSGTSTPTWNTSGGTNSDGAVTWQDDGTTNAFPQEGAVGSNYTGCPAGVGLGNCDAPGTAGVWSILSSNCVLAGGHTSPCTAALIANTFPIVWEQPWLYWANLIHACYDGDTLPCPGPHTGNPGVIFHYANVFAAPSQMDYIRFGCVGGGECFPWENGTIQTAFGFTQGQLANVWANGANSMYAAIASSWAQTSAPWHAMATVNLFPATCVLQGCATLAIALAADIASYHTIALGSEGLQIGDLANLATPGNITSNDWVAMFTQYRGAVPFLELQTANSSYIAGQSTLGNCTSAQQQTGNLAAIFPFATQHYVNYVEAYNLDLMAAFNPNFTAGTLCTTYTNGQAANYQTVMQNSGLGVPNATSAMIGLAGKLGNSGDQ